MSTLNNRVMPKPNLRFVSRMAVGHFPFYALHYAPGLARHTRALHFRRYITLKYLSLIAIFFSSVSFAATETTSYAKITGIETRGWGMHVQVDVSVGQTAGCKVDPGAAYMLDLIKSKVSQTGENYEFVQSAILAAFMAQSDISFHIYECSSSGRPVIGHVRLKR